MTLGSKLIGHPLLSDETENELQSKAGINENDKNMIRISEADLDTIKIKMSLSIDNVVVINTDTAPASF